MDRAHSKLVGRRSVLGMAAGAMALLSACRGTGSSGGGTAPRTAGTPTEGVTIKVQDTGAKLPTV